MKTRTIWQKLKSTKLWCAVAGITVGAALALGVNASTIQTVAGAVTSVAALVTYIVTEGKIDAAAVGKTVQAVEDAVNAVKSVTAAKDTAAASDDAAADDTAADTTDTATDTTADTAADTGGAAA